MVSAGGGWSKALAGAIPGCKVTSMLSRIVLACFLHLLVRVHLKAAEPARIIIIQPGYPGSTRDAEGFVSQLADYVGGKTGLQGISGEYHNEEKRALSAL